MPTDPHKPGLRTSEGLLTVLLHGVGFALSVYSLYRIPAASGGGLVAAVVFVAQAVLQVFYVRSRTGLKEAILDLQDLQKCSPLGRLSLHSEDPFLSRVRDKLDGTTKTKPPFSPAP